MIFLLLLLLQQTAGTFHCPAVPCVGHIPYQIAVADGTVAAGTADTATIAHCLHTTTQTTRPGDAPTREEPSTGGPAGATPCRPGSGPVGEHGTRRHKRSRRRPRRLHRLGIVLVGHGAVFARRRERLLVVQLLLGTVHHHNAARSGRRAGLCPWLWRRYGRQESRRAARSLRALVRTAGHRDGSRWRG
ncbi:hypothetical protein BC831DRAFT_461315 [Entophlyctis helioformis]|nr:hypothetical protein BC831DRAFT_461315 [Entophlyctis helioformis]